MLAVELAQAVQGERLLRYCDGLIEVTAVHAFDTLRAFAKEMRAHLTPIERELSGTSLH